MPVMAMVLMVKKGVLSLTMQPSKTMPMGWEGVEVWQPGVQGTTVTMLAGKNKTKQLKEVVVRRGASMTMSMIEMMSLTPIGVMESCGVKV